MDTRRCALLLIKCVQGFAAIFRKWMTWKCNFQCIALLLLAKAFFLSLHPVIVVQYKYIFPYSFAYVHECLYVSYSGMCIRLGVCMSPHLWLHVSDCCNGLVMSVHISLYIPNIWLAAVPHSAELPPKQDSIQTRGYFWIQRLHHNNWPILRP